MSLFDRLHTKWKHADPAVRLPAVRKLTDQRVLAEVAANDASDDVRLAAIETLSDQDALAGFAGGDGKHALAACTRVTNPGALARLAESALQTEVRRQAVERTTNQAALLRIATVDPDPAIRALARTRGAGGDRAGNYLREMISQLQVAGRKEGAPVEYTGTLDEICQALAQDPRFLINGELAQEDHVGAASLANPTQAPWTIPAFANVRLVARFIAQKRSAVARADGGLEPVDFFQIKVWRTGDDKYDAVAVQKQLAQTSDPVLWSQASGTNPQAQPAFGREAEDE